MCPAPICPFGGNIAMLQRFNCANRVWRIPKAMSDLELCDNKTMVYLFFIQIDKISIFWLTTDNFHFRNLFSGALMFFFFSNYRWLLKRTAQTVTLLEKSGIVWSHTGLETFQRRNCKGLWERNNGCVLHNQNSHRLNQKLYYWHLSHPSALLLVFFFWCSSWRGLLYVSSGDSAYVHSPVWENCRIHHFKLLYQNYVMM